MNNAADRANARREFAASLRRTRRNLHCSWQEWARRANVSFGLLSMWRRAKTVPSSDALRRLAMAASVALDDLAPAARERAAAKAPVAQFLESRGFRFARAADKRVPEAIFRLPREGMALFLRALFSCDGSVYVRRSGIPGVSYSSISRQLAVDVQHLLLRFGLVAKLRVKRQIIKGQPYRTYELQMLGIAATARFLDQIGIVGRETACQAIRQSAAKPMTFAALRRQSGVTILDRRHVRPRCRDTVAALAHTLRDPALAALGLGDVWWDEVVEIRDAGEEPVFDLTVDGEPNFVANDLIIHNSTLLLQAARALAKARPPVLYVSAEESAAQVKMRADRLGIAGDGLLLWAENDLNVVQAALDDVKPQALIVDSIQTVFLPDLESAPGSVAQVRECGARLMTQAKGRGLATFLVGHVTKEGALAGPRVLEHLVDTVLYFEGEQHHAYRVLRAVKNRFGSTNEIGVFEMAARGLVEVPNPSGFFLSERPVDAPGSVVVASLEGTRPMLLELQALVSRASFGTPRRTVLGADYNRVCLLLAVLEKRAQLPIGNQDVFVNVAGGGRVLEPAADLAIVLAAASSYMERPLPADVVVLGEVGLTGEVRAVAGLESRLRAAAQLGFHSAVVPKSSAAEAGAAPLKVRGVATVAEAVEALLP
ncbi:MAG: DNA repair protein RadA [Candidatus Rokuibacteriota bacterium]|nr:MAG: DNA repair protein RadA [Candidatus Rokubacteria bacterium]